MTMRTLLVVSVLWVGCTPPSEQRAELDRAVGRKESSGLSLVVSDGLAAVRYLDAERLSLWCSAPEFTVELESDDDRSLSLELNNVMRDAKLTLLSGDGEAPIATEDDGVATRKRARLPLRRGSNRVTIRTTDSKDRSPWRFALMSDVQTGIDRVQDVFRSINGEDGVRFLLGAGDLSSTGSREQLERFQDELVGLRVPYYTTLGNHDSPEAGLWQELYGRGNFRFVFRGVQFTLLDSASATIDPLAYQWLDEWLDEGLPSVHVFAMHIPALDPVGIRNGAFGSRNEAGKLLSALQEGNVSLTLYGHIHSFYQFENAGIPAFISGGGGAFEEALDGYERHYMVFEIGAEVGVVSSGMFELQP
jgi:predicted phosphodiesterase